MAIVKDSASAHRFVVVRLDESEVPTETFEVVEGDDRISAIRLAHQFARTRSHRETDKAFAVVELKADGGYLDRVATAGFARIALVRPKVVVEDLVLAWGARCSPAWSSLGA